MNRPALSVVTSDSERLEGFISTAKEFMVEASKRGDTDWAIRWAGVMTDLIRKRAPEQIQRMEARIK